MHAVGKKPVPDNRVLLVAVTGLIFLLSGCIPDLGSSEADAESSAISNNTSSTSQPGQSQRVTAQSLGLPRVSDEQWDDTAVRKVLHTFAYGGHATDAQISAWAETSGIRAY